MISEYGIIEIDKNKKEWNELYNYQKKKFALKKIRELYFRKTGVGKLYCIAWYDVIHRETHCRIVDRKMNLKNYSWNDLIDNNSKGSLPIRKVKWNSDY